MFHSSATFLITFKHNRISSSGPKTTDSVIIWLNDWSKFNSLSFPFSESSLFFILKDKWTAENFTTYKKLSIKHLQLTIKLTWTSINSSLLYDFGWTETNQSFFRLNKVNKNKLLTWRESNDDETIYMTYMLGESLLPLYRLPLQSLVFDRK